jgi:hypothetical protein
LFPYGRVIPIYTFLALFDWMMARDELTALAIVCFLLIKTAADAATASFEELGFTQASFAALEGPDGQGGGT